MHFSIRIISEMLPLVIDEMSSLFDRTVLATVSVI